MTRLLFCAALANIKAASLAFNDNDFKKGDFDLADYLQAWASHAEMSRKLFEPLEKGFSEEFYRIRA